MTTKDIRCAQPYRSYLHQQPAHRLWHGKLILELANAIATPAGASVLLSPVRPGQQTFFRYQRLP